MSIDLKQIHIECGWHEQAILKSNVCGCFNCLSFFPPSQIIDWVEERENCPRGPGKTALCPECGIDAVLPDIIKEGLSEGLLRAMREEYFN
jgi:hypothetical protein